MNILFLTLIWVEGVISWNGKSCNPSILKHSLHFVRDVRAIFGIPYWPQSPDIDQNSDEGFSDFLISGQSLLKRNVRTNSRTSNNIDMKVGAATKINTRNKTMSKKFVDDNMSGNCYLIAIFPIYGQLGAIWKPDSGRIVSKTYIFINPFQDFLFRGCSWIGWCKNVPPP